MLNWFSQASPFELFALVTGLAAVILLIRQNIWTWPVGVAYAAVGVWVFSQEGLYGQLLLHVFYVGMNLYGWWYWTRGAQEEPLRVIKLTGRGLLLAGGCGIVGTLVLGYVLAALSSAELAWADALVTSFSFVAMYLQARKYLDCWGFWFVINIGSIGLYAAAGLNFYAALYFVYLGLAVAGYVEWRNSRNNC